MLHLIQSNRQPALAAALCATLAHAPARDPFTSEHIVVPSAALRRRLELDLAGTFGVAANLRFAYLASWLWEQIAKVAPVPEQSPFSPDRLSWRLYRLLEVRDWQAPGHERLARYLDRADPAMRHALAGRIAEVFDHYLTYRPEYLGRWQRGESLFAGDAQRASEVNRADERWQATLWRRVLEDLGDPLGEPVIAERFLSLAAGLDAQEVRAVWPARVSVFAPPTIAPLHAALLREFGRFIDVDLYLLNPCREFWHDIVTERQVGRLKAADRVDYQEVGHPLLAEWGRQTQALLHIVHEMTEASVDEEADAFESNPASTWLASVQNAILELRRWPALGAAGREAEDAAHGEGDDPGGATGLADGEHPGQEAVAFADAADDSIEVHICHSLTRQLEALHDRLLAWFDADPELTPADVLVALPDLPSAAPAIDAVFGGGDGSRVPYRITGLPPSRANAVARVMLEWLALSDASVGAPQLIEWLRIDAIAARFGIDAAALDTLQEWLAAAGARRGLAFDAGDAPARRRHTFADALLRLYLGYALPDDAEPVEDWLPTAGPAGAEADLLGRLSAFVDELDRFTLACRRSRDAGGWQRLVNDALPRFFDAGPAFADDLADLRDGIDALARSIGEGAGALEIPVEVLRDALAASLDDPARGGVPAGSVTFSALSSLRGVPFRVICLLGLDDGVLPNATRAPEFDLLAAFPKLGDRQRRDDDRNLFLDYLLAATDRFVIGYTGRSIRDNAIKPPAAPVDELLDYLGAALAGESAKPEVIAQARAGFVVEHPLQPYAAEYLGKDGPLFTYDATRADVASALLGPRRNRLPTSVSVSASGSVSESTSMLASDFEPAVASTSTSASTSSSTRPFFNVALPPPDDDIVSFDALLAFWSQPARALLRDRLGLNFRSAQAELDDSEPFSLDWDGRDALADRLLPLLVDGGADLARAARIARASHELPGGATGAIWRDRELNSLARLAQAVHAARGDTLDVVPYFAIELSACWPARVREGGLPLLGDLADAAEVAGSRSLVLDGALPALTSLGQVVYRHAMPTARDYLSTWLHHLVLCATRPAGVERSTYWIGRGARFAFREDPDAHKHLAELVTLYRAGLCVPLPFFPKTSWAWVDKGENAAFIAWQGGFDRAGEQDDPYVSTAWRGTAVRFDARFDALARDVLEPLRAHLGTPGTGTGSAAAAGGDA